VNYAITSRGCLGTDSTVVTQFRLSASLDGRVWKTVAICHASVAIVQCLHRAARTGCARASCATSISTLALQTSPSATFASSATIRPGTGDAGRAGSAARQRRAQRRHHMAGVPGVVGYNLRWGISPSKLYQTYQRFADQGTTARAAGAHCGAVVLGGDRELRRKTACRDSAPPCRSGAGLENRWLLARAGMRGCCATSTGVDVRPLHQTGGRKPRHHAEPNRSFPLPINDSVVAWEEYATFNPAAVVKGGKVFLRYRAEDASGERQIGRRHTSRLGLARAATSALHAACDSRAVSRHRCTEAE